MIEPPRPEAIPTDYRAGYAHARELDAALADNYLHHVQIGDPLADALIAALGPYPPAQGQEWIRLGIEEGPAALADAPEAVRAFFEALAPVPSWFDPSRVGPGCTAFHRNSAMFLGAFVGGVLVEGFATLISKSFSITGRVRDQGVRRLKQNNRHLMEILLPGGLERHGDGWRLSVRLRLVHARIRLMLTHSEDWDSAAWGVPLSAAHMALSSSVFSALLLKRAEQLGVRLNDAERESFMMIWRYTAHLMGVPAEILFDSQSSALHLIHIATTCEPPPGDEAIIMANALIQSAPVVAGITEPKARRKLARYIFRVSRGLIGDTLADQLRYPVSRSLGTVGLLRVKNSAERGLQRLFPKLEQRSRYQQFQQLMDLSLYAEEGIRYRMPGELYAERDKEL